LCPKLIATVPGERGQLDGVNVADVQANFVEQVPDFAPPEQEVAGRQDRHKVAVLGELGVVGEPLARLLIRRRQGGQVERHGDRVAGVLSHGCDLLQEAKGGA
jgi:hypothetical protein